MSHEDLGETDFPYILVESTGQALLDIAKLYRDSFDIKVVGITGSVGKTSTKEMIASVLSQKYNVHKTLGNFNNEWGLPITIFEMNETHEVAILEMGVNHFGEMRRLSSVASPDICVITNIGIAHLEFFKTREGIFQEKSQMIQDMKNGGTIILNGDDDILSGCGPIKGVAPQFFGIGKNNEFYADNITSLGLKGTSCTIHLPSGECFDCTVPLPGAHMVSNALSGAAVGYNLDLTAGEIKAGIEHLPSIPGRGAIISTDKLVILDDCYNANPMSMKASLDVLQDGAGRRIAVLGDMGELGENEVQLHEEVGEHAGKCDIDVLICTGKLCRNMAERAQRTNPDLKVIYEPDRESLLEHLEGYVQDGDTILVKASHFMKFEEVVTKLENM